jgi:hypothetical protein
MSEAGFDLRKWETNSHELRAYKSSQEGVTSDLEPGGDDIRIGMGYQQGRICFSIQRFIV